LLLIAKPSQAIPSFARPSQAMSSVVASFHRYFNCGEFAIDAENSLGYTRDEAMALFEALIEDPAYHKMVDPESGIVSVRLEVVTLVLEAEGEGLGFG